jgi:hypothetical protein
MKFHDQHKPPVTDDGSENHNNSSRNSSSSSDGGWEHVKMVTTQNSDNSNRRNVVIHKGNATTTHTTRSIRVGPTTLETVTSPPAGSAPEGGTDDGVTVPSHYTAAAATTATPTNDDFAWVVTPAADAADDDAVVPTSATTTATSLVTTVHRNDKNTINKTSTDGAVVVSRGIPHNLFAVTTQNNVNNTLQTGETVLSSDLRRLSIQAAYRQAEVRTRIHGVACTMAQWTAKLAHERLQRQASLPALRTRIVDEPAQHLVQSIQSVRRQTIATMDQTNVELKPHKPEGGGNGAGILRKKPSSSQSASTDPRWQRVERRLMALDTQMTASVHALATTRRQRLLALYDTFIYKSVPQWMTQRTAETKVEMELYNELDALVGRMAALQAQHTAQRAVLVQRTADQLTQASVNYRQRHVALQQALLELQAELETTRQARQAADVALRQRVQSTQAALQQAVLAAVGDP